MIALLLALGIIAYAANTYKSAHRGVDYAGTNDNPFVTARRDDISF